MIKLTKQPEPEILAENSVAWTKTLLEKGEAATSAEKSRYRHPKIKDVLVLETFGKCAYCESKIRHVSYGDVEHIHPKSLAPENTFSWDNLTLACDVCNTNKGSLFENPDDFVDPYVDEPSEHFRAAGPMLLPLPESNAGYLTATTLKLNRPELIERRCERINRLLTMVRLFEKEGNPAVKAAILRDIKENELCDGSEYAAISRQFLKSFLPAGVLEA